MWLLGEGGITPFFPKLDCKSPFSSQHTETTLVFPLVEVFLCMLCYFVYREGSSQCCSLREKKEAWLIQL